MSEFLKDARIYLYEIFIEGWKWLFSIFDLMGFILFLFPDLATRVGVNKHLVQIIGGTVFCLSFVIANFVSYRELLHKTEKTPFHLTFREDSVQWKNGGSSRGIPTDPFICTICLDIKNEGDEPGRLNDISVERIELSKEFAQNESKKVLWYKLNNDPNQPKTRLEFPHPLEARVWNFRLECRIEMQFLAQGEEWAKKLNDLHKFEIELSYKYESIDGDKSQETLTIHGTFADYRRKILSDWIRSKQYDLFFAAVDVDDLLNRIAC